MGPLISVIVPVYKVEAYLRQCIDSICNQTYRNLEIILVDDGSPDCCGEICDFYAAQDARISVMHKKNGGLSDARNAGIMAAKGDYLMFVDSDDWLENDAVEYLYQLIETYHAQMAIGGTQRIEDGTNRILKSDWNEKNEEVCMTNIQAMDYFFKNGCAAWARLYCRKIHEGILFPDGEINEDEAIVLPLLEGCNAVIRTNHIIYNYRSRPESITTSSFSAKKLAWYRHCVDNLEWIKQNHSVLESAASDRLCGSLMWSLTEIALSQNYEQAWVRELQSCLHTYYPVFRKAYCHGGKQTIRLLTLRYLPFAFYRNLIRKKRGM